MTSRLWLSLLILVPLCGIYVAQRSMKDVSTNDVLLYQRGVSHRITGTAADSLVIRVRHMLDGSVERLRLLVRSQEVEWARGGSLALEVRFATPYHVASTNDDVAHVLIPLGPEAEERFGAGVVVAFWGTDERFVSGPFTVHDRALLAEVQRFAAATNNAPERPNRP